MYHKLTSVVFCLSLAGTVADADDWPQWRGPQRDGVYRETGLIEAIPEAGLPVKWKAPVGLGYAGPAVVGGNVFLFDYVLETGEIANSPGGTNALTGKERLQCLDRRTGDVVWSYSYDCPYSLSYASGPRATPTVAGGKVYLLGAMGHLTCLDAKDGTVVWNKDLKQEYGAETPIWGFCGHPLVDGGTLYCLVGGAGSVAVAFDKDTGEQKWQALSAKQPGYCPPTMIEAAGVKQLLIWHAESLNSLNPKTGETHWSLPLQPDYDMSIAAPLKQGDLLFASGIGNIGALFRLDDKKPEAQLVKRGDTTTYLYSANSTPIIVGDTMYGMDCRGGQLRGVDFESGERLWESLEPVNGKRPVPHGTAFLTKIGDGSDSSRFFLFSETGDLILADLTREKYEELGRFHVLEPTGEAFGRSVVWSHPAYAGKCLFARNDKELVCVSLAAKK